MPKYNNPRKTWRYPDDFKSKAVQLSLLSGIRVKEVAKTLDIHPFMLSRWRKEYWDKLFVQLVKGISQWLLCVVSSTSISFHY